MKRETKELKRMLKAKSNELDEILKSTGPKGEGWDVGRVQRLIREIGVLNEKIADAGRKRIAPSSYELPPWTTDPHLREIEQKLLEKDAPESLLVCPECGEPDRGNRMNNQPWCFQCNTQLVPKSRVEQRQTEKIKIFKEKYPRVTFTGEEA